MMDYKQLVASIPDYSNKTDEQGHYAWHESYYLRGLVEVVKKTDDIEILTEAVRRISNILNSRDNSRQVASYDDTFWRGMYKNSRSFPGWRNLNYNNNKPYQYFLHDAMLTYPMLSLADYLGDSPFSDRTFVGTFLDKSDVTFKQISEIILDICRQNIDGHEFKWTNGKYYYYNTSTPHEFILNYYSAVARPILLTQVITEKHNNLQSELYAQRVAVLSQLIIDQLIIDDHGNCFFYYDNLRMIKHYDDISHGAITADYIALLSNYQRQINPDTQKVALLAAGLNLTLEKIVSDTLVPDPMIGNMLVHQISTYIDGEIDSSKKIPMASIGRWLMVMDKESEVYKRVIWNFRQYLEYRIETRSAPSGYEFLGYSLILARELEQ